MEGVRMTSRILWFLLDKAWGNSIVNHSKGIENSNKYNLCISNSFIVEWKKSDIVLGSEKRVVSCSLLSDLHFCHASSIFRILRTASMGIYYDK